ncbi:MULTISPECIES: hypothetical protein [Bacillaceae]|uniref:hypothetical protein n=1 Tax=Bacillaceae TaxID=186817 RepID=UPI0004E1EA5F|nr:MULTISPECIES: hypothetical protein [Bacillaceae]MCF2650679.1 hypothetical protein [Niallia circulans]CAI9396681.1 hypothetical protein BACSP_04354 [Bacillus sp. T2.9-1]
MIKLFRKRWMLFEQVVKSYKPFVTVEYGVIPVPVDDIIGLSLPVSKIRNSVNEHNISDTLFHINPGGNLK